MKLAISNLVAARTLGRSLQPSIILSKALSITIRILNASFARDSDAPTRSRGFCALPAKSGFTLVEMTVVIAVILVLVGAASLGIKPYYAYRDGRSAGEALRAVKAAQLMYLADNPSAALTSLTGGPTGNLTPYMPNGTWPTLPTVGTVVPTINCTVFPPVALLSGITYDPSPTITDGLWDVGLY
jgi:prepilin-type N-terminal cleavage/methylation domain-containing protein